MLDTADTIVAISSAAGVSDRGIVRVSGDAAFEAAAKIFTCVHAKTQFVDIGGFSWVDGLISAGGVQFPARAYVFRNPRSYTRQDLIEFHVPGNPCVMDMVTEALLDGGCRKAGPGEFTARAFFSGRIDLSQAQAVSDIIEADDDQQLRSALSVLGGVVYRLCSRAAVECTDILAVVEASIDLGDEDIELDTPHAIAMRLETLAGELKDVANRASDMPEKSHHPVVVIAGKPNVGKSSLLNCLSGTDRAIVSALAGTTRDVLSAFIEINGRDVEFRDVAGFMPAADAIQQAADQAARSAVSQADVIIMMLDITCDGFEEDFEMFERIRKTNRNAAVIWAANKSDIRSSNPMLKEDILLISANSGLGVDALREQLADILQLSVSRGGAVLGLHSRQKRSLEAAADASLKACGLLRSVGSIADVSELAAIDIRQCLRHIGRITGEVVNEDVLGRIFERFCVGK